MACVIRGLDLWWEGELRLLLREFSMMQESFKSTVKSQPNDEISRILTKLTAEGKKNAALKFQGIESAKGVLPLTSTDEVLSELKSKHPTAEPVAVSLCSVY